MGRLALAAVLFWSLHAHAAEPLVTPELMERLHVQPLGDAGLHRLIEGHTITFRSLTDKTEETYHYGTTRTDRNGRSSEWGLAENGFIEDSDDGQRLVQVYYYHKRYYACSSGACRRVIQQSGK